AMVRAFDISKTDAESLMLSAESGGMALRKLSTTTEGAMVFGFQRSAPVDTLLGTKRFTSSGTVGSGGKKYLLAPKPVTTTPGQSDLAFEALAALEVKGAPDVLVWFPDQKLLVFGSDALVTDIAKVLAGGAPPLTENPQFAAATKDFPGDARLR